MKQDEVARHEIIGLTIRITEASNPDLVGLEGKVLDETKNSFVIETASGRKTVLKNQITQLMIVEKNITVQASSLMKRSEERIKGG
jgi:ribonuclease P protein subunit POP4